MPYIDLTHNLHRDLYIFYLGHYGHGVAKWHDMEVDNWTYNIFSIHWYFCWIVQMTRAIYNTLGIYVFISKNCDRLIHGWIPITKKKWICLLVIRSSMSITYPNVQTSYILSLLNTFNEDAYTFYVRLINTRIYDGERQIWNYLNYFIQNILLQNHIAMLLLTTTYLFRK